MSAIAKRSGQCGNKSSRVGPRKRFRDVYVATASVFPASGHRKARRTRRIWFSVRKKTSHGCVLRPSSLAPQLHACILTGVEYDRRSSGQVVLNCAHKRAISRSCTGPRRNLGRNSRSDDAKVLVETTGGNEGAVAQSQLASNTPNRRSALPRVIGADNVAGICMAATRRLHRGKDMMRRQKNDSDSLNGSSFAHRRRRA